MELFTSLAPQFAAPVALVLAAAAAWGAWHKILETLGTHMRAELRDTYATREQLDGVAERLERIDTKLDTLVSQVWEARGRQVERDAAPRPPERR